MTKRWMPSCLALLIAVLAIAGLSGCSGTAANVPSAVVTQAVEVQAQAEQTALWQQLSLPDSAPPKLSVSQVKVRQRRPVQVAADTAYELAGTYQYTLRYPDRRRVKQSQVPFTVVLQPETEAAETWRLLRLETSAPGDRTWHWQPLAGDRA